MTATSNSWNKSNQRYLSDSIAQIKSLLELYKDSRAEDRSKWEEPIQESPDWNEEYPPAIVNICRLFGLSYFERCILLLCTGVELSSDFTKLCAELQENSGQAYPTFALALAALPEPHWSAIIPTSPLRYFRLIEMYNVTFPQSLTTNPLRIDERVLHYLTGISYLEPRLTNLITPIKEMPALTNSQRILAEQILASYKKKEAKLPVVQLWGKDESSKLSLAQDICTKMGLDLWVISSEVIPTKPEEIELFLQLWIREAALMNMGLYVSLEDSETKLSVSLSRLIDKIPGPIFLGARERVQMLTDPSISLEVKKPTKTEQFELWRTCMGSTNMDNQEIYKLLSQFNLSASTIISASNEALLLSKTNADRYDILWNATIAVTRPKILGLAQQIISRVRMDDLVLPEREKKLLEEIMIHVKQRMKVYEEWGFGHSSDRGLGITSLFSGPSGTGKTMAAEVLANELNLDLFRIDLSTIVSKYIGETEKNLRNVFDAAEDGGSILFFDEADSLLGKRTEIRDSHDRYSNMEINYLLQRMESYSGLAILATNMKNAIDSAFIRRIRFIINFPFPEEKTREEIWKRVFPPSTPLENINTHRLARLNISGGNIHNIAVNASFLAADENVSVSMKHIKQATYREYAKMERPVSQELANFE